VAGLGLGVLLVVSCGVSRVGLPVDPETETSAGSGAPAANEPAPAANEPAPAANGPAPAVNGPAPAGTGYPPPGSGATPPASAPSGASPADPVLPQPALASVVVHARKVKADRIVAGVVFARKLHARSGSITTLADPLSVVGLVSLIGADDIKVGDLRADVLYADDIQAESVQIREAHVSDLKMKDDDTAED
jgi:hypothetical protein